MKSKTTYTSKNKATKIKNKLIRKLKVKKNNF